MKGRSLAVANKRVKFARGARPTPKSDALLLAAHSRRWASRNIETETCKICVLRGAIDGRIISVED